MKNTINSSVREISPAVGFIRKEEFEGTVCDRKTTEWRPEDNKQQVQHHRQQHHLTGSGGLAHIRQT